MTKPIKESKPKQTSRTRKKSEAASPTTVGIYSHVVTDAHGRPELIIDWDKLKEHVRKCG